MFCLLAAVAVYSISGVQATCEGQIIAGKCSTTKQASLQAYFSLAYHWWLNIGTGLGMFTDAHSVILGAAVAVGCVYILCWCLAYVVVPT